ncbi:MAG: hypothetical protein ACRDJT_16355 [Actinomycetota bacterium]
MARQDRVSQAMFAQELNTENLLALPNVIGTATGYRQKGGQYSAEVCVQVFVESKYAVDRLPSGGVVPNAVTAEGDRTVRTDVIESGPLDTFQDTTRYRPVPGGCSIGPQQSVSAGTLGGWACDNTDDAIVLMTNNHVISNLDTLPAITGICQPGRLDGGTFPADQIGTIKRHIALTTVPAGSPTLPPVTAVDAAIGTITVDRTDNVIDTGPAIYEVQAPALGMNVQKRGRTTRLTTNGRVTSINGTFNINYRNRTRLGRIANSFVITSTDGNQFSAAGDSGSLIFNQAVGELNNTLPVVGLLYAGGTNNAGVPITIANDINAVLTALNLTTVCNGAVRALLEAIFGSSAAMAGPRRKMRRKEQQLRRLRGRVLARTPLGKRVVEFVDSNAADLSGALLEDEEAFGLTVRLVEPWLRRGNNFEILEGKVDAETVQTFSRLAERLAKIQPHLREPIATFSDVISKAEGTTVRALLSKGARPKRKKTKATRQKK